MLMNIKKGLHEECVAINEKRLEKTGRGQDDEENEIVK